MALGARHCLARRRVLSRSDLPTSSGDSSQHGRGHQPEDHEKLDVYQTAVDWVALAREVVAAMPDGKGHGPLADQLQRAASSFTLNIAEGAGEFCLPRSVRATAGSSPLAQHLAAHRSDLVPRALVGPGG
jgi:hypothetical protein